MLLTPRQQEIVRLALDRALRPGDRRWSAGGLLAQIALLTGNTEAELKHWDEVGNGDGPLTLDRIQESGNGFAGWSLDALEALDGVWRAGSDRRALDAVLERFGAPLQLPDGETAVTEPYTGPERRGALSVNLDLKSALFMIGFVAAILPLILFFLQLRVDIRQNSADDIRRDATLASQQAQIDALKVTASKFERAHALYCSGMRRDSSRVPDADC